MRSLATSGAVVLLLFGCHGGDEPVGPGGGAGGSTTSSGGHAGQGGEGGHGGEGPVVVTAEGPVRGTVVGATHAFLGIPYAAPPTGERRFRPPAPVTPWTAPLDATAPGPVCLQRDLVGGQPVADASEDCLTLNVWTPASAATEPLPVMVWIHGGGFEIGSGWGDGMYTGEHLVPTGQVVLVTVNYRLGPFGFLAHPSLAAEDDGGGEELGSGNYGLDDQRLALGWVQENVAAFGGDPGEVTLFGESAGGISVCAHLVSPLSQGLFHRAIVESGPCELLAADEKAAEAQGADLVAAVGCDGAPDVPACLRAEDPTAILTALPTAQAMLFGGGARWRPATNGDTLPDPRVALASGSFAKVPVVLGSNRDEGALFVALAGLQGIDEAEYVAAVTELVQAHAGDPQVVLAEYPASAYASPGKALAALVGECIFNCPTRRMARALAKHVEARLYHFVYPLPFPALGDLGAFHGAEATFVFDSNVFGFGALSAAEKPLSATIMGYWSRFAAKGDPNGDGAVDWPVYLEATDESLELDLDEVKTEVGLRQEKCDFWDAIVAPSS